MSRVMLTKDEFVSVTDVAEATSGFISRIDDMPSIDDRTDDHLIDVALGHSDAVERERAIWELTYRQRDAAGPLLRQALASDPEPAVRANLLWLGVKLLDNDVFDLLLDGTRDESRDVRDWAKLHLYELTGEEQMPEYTSAVFTVTGPFDQTLPLQISGFAIVTVGHIVMRVTLSPLWFAQILGRVMACTNIPTFMTHLVIEKCLTGFHPDGSNHYEVFPFRGSSWQSPDGRNHHRYESRSSRIFYPSGLLEDTSQGIERQDVILNRAATSTNSIRELELLEVQGDVAEDGGAGGARRQRLSTETIVCAVRGQYFGWAHADVGRYLDLGVVAPGTVQLVSAQSDAANTYLAGTFRGKLSDYDGDGHLDINLVKSHATPEGTIDYGAASSVTDDPFAS
jgi:hypothetical protein